MSKNALVTGANRGIGAAIASSLSVSGWRVINVSRTADESDGQPCYQLDLSDVAEIPTLIDEIKNEMGPIDCLVANAGITNDTLLMRADVAGIEEVLRVNLTASIVLAKEVLRGMIKNRFGRIIFISSVVALSGSGGQVSYAASKAGLIGAARSLAREIGSRGITVNVISPGFIETDMTKDLPEQARNQAKAITPLARLGETADIGGVAAFLASDEASYITGAVIPVDGGLGMGH